MQQEFWNERYGEEAYAYGTEPNDFLKEQHFEAGTNVLCLAEGEGRNAVWVAKQGCEVTCVDYSEEGIRKATLLAAANNVSVKGICADLNVFSPETNHFDYVVIIFGHFNPELRKKVLSLSFDALKPGGKLIMEVYHKEQINFKTGGPQNTDFLYDETETAQELEAFSKLDMMKLVREVHEGEFHAGKAAVLQVIAEK